MGRRLSIIIRLDFGCNKLLSIRKIINIFINTSYYNLAFTMTNIRKENLSRISPRSVILHLFQQTPSVLEPHSNVLRSDSEFRCNHIPSLLRDVAAVIELFLQSVQLVRGELGPGSPSWFGRFPEGGRRVDRNVRGNCRLLWRC